MIYSFLYTIIMLLALPFVLISGKRRKKYFSTFKDRLGFPSEIPDLKGKPSIWIHTVSVGETLAAKALIAQLKKKYSGHAIVVSTTTITGQQTAIKNLEADAFIYCPFDWKFSVRRTCNLLKPDLCIIMETEIWPNMIKVLSSRNVPLVLLNGRISDRSFKRYKSGRWFFGPLLRKFYCICAQGSEDAERFRAIGANPADILVTGNLKFDVNQFSVNQSSLERLKDRLAISENSKIFIAGSTHSGEEEIVLSAFENLKKKFADLRLILVPRKPEKFEDVANLLAKAEHNFQRYTEETPVLEGEIILVDTIGLLMSLYQLSDVAFVGGSLVNIGGHNLLEVCAAGKPVLFGPHMHNFRYVRDQVLEAGAGVEIENGQQLEQTISKLLTDNSYYRQMSRAAQQVIDDNQQALPKTLDAIAPAFSWIGIPFQPKPLLKTLAFLHRAGARLLSGNPERQLSKAERLDRPVISVGGLSFGGSGKTPLISSLAEHFLRQGKNVSLITRGYKGVAEDPFIVSDGKGEIKSAEFSGDEPVMLARKHPQITVIKDANRFRGGLLAERIFKPDIILLDDGFQHRALWRNFNLLMLDSDSFTGPRWGGQLLRENLAVASAADALVLIASTNNRTDAAREVLTSRFPEKPIFNARYKITSVVDLNDSSKHDINLLREQTLCAVSGIAQPARFVETLIGEGLNIAKTRYFADHYQFTDKDIEQIHALLLQAKADAIITTEKDAQRLKLLTPELLKQVNILVATASLNIECFEELTTLIQARL